MGIGGQVSFFRTNMRQFFVHIHIFIIMILSFLFARGQKHFIYLHQMLVYINSIVHLYPLPVYLSFDVYARRPLFDLLRSEVEVER